MIIENNEKTKNKRIQEYVSVFKVEYERSSRFSIL